jgi:eukaryotic-like serine/threonine-protein kinase
MISERALDRLAGMLRAPDVSGTRYEIVSELGRGGMGIVYLARDTALDREVALKIVERTDAGTRGGTPAALALEARILARLEHPGIVPVHDFGELPDGRLYYAMKRVRGDRLDRWLAAGRDLPQRLTVFLRVCDAVAFAHAHGIVHRDLKPENVMIGEFGEVLVLDWGIARPEAPDIESSSTRNPEPQQPGHETDQPGVPILEPIAGTPEFMSPEQRRGGAIDHRSDVYALGVMLDALGGAAPLAAIARKARADEPAGRYQRVQDLAADVQRFLDGRAVAVHREPILDWVARIWRRHRLPILVVVTYLALRLLLLWAARV